MRERRTGISDAMFAIGTAIALGSFWGCATYVQASSSVLDNGAVAAAHRSASAGAEKGGAPTAAARETAAGHASGDTIPLYGNLGPHTRSITTASPLAQAYFDQAKQLTFAYGHPEALPSFREAQRQDPQCAMCYWGEAWAQGPYLNSSMDEDEGRAAYAAIQKAMELRHRGTDVERALIEAMATRYEPEPNEEHRARLDSAYADAMRSVVRRFPNDLDAGSLLGEALMLLRPRRFWDENGDPMPGVEEMLAVLESVLARDIKHPGACHHYIHLVEAGPEPERAEACANYLGNAIPGASHINHMPSHIYMNIGRYGDAVRANQQAWHTDLKAAHGGPPGIYPSHNLHMMLFGAWLDGQSAVAMQAARDLARIAENSAFYVPLALVRFGRWEEVLELADGPDTPFQGALWDFSRGMATLRLGDAETAWGHLAEVDRVVDELPDSMSQSFRRHKQRDLLLMARGILAGEIEASAGRYDQAIEALRAAAAVEDNLNYDEPEPWPIPVRHVLGAVLLEAGWPSEAEVEYEKQLDHHKENGWSLFGLAQSLEAQGKDEEAAEVWQRFERAWPRSDLWIRSSRF
jgi:tetratricopeptide (TPR) repeat protein